MQNDSQLLMNFRCKETQLPPICDGSHRNIRAEESDNSDDNKINSNILKLKVIID
jgi:CDGSH-type Zn-finger protein